MTRIITISVTNADVLLLDDRKISPSAVFRTAIERIRNQTDPETTQRDQYWLEKIQSLTNQIQKMNLFLEKRKIIKDFYQETVKEEE
jgi:hypothetical protein